MRTSTKQAAWAVMAAAFVFASAWSAAAATSPADKCEMAKNKLTGKYAACRQSAEARAIKSGVSADYSKCDDKFQGSWQKAEDRASAGGGACPDEPLDPNAMQSFIGANSGAIATALNGGPLPEDATACNADLATCTGDLSTCNGSLETCNASNATCTTSLATCNAGTAVAADVLSSKTFSSAGGLGVAGTMANVGQQNVTPGVAAATITQGYHDGTGTVAGDADLVAASIKTGVNLFGVDGNVIQASGDAVDAEVLSSKTFSNAGGAGTGTMTNVGQQNVTPGIAAVTITQGYHNGTGTVAGDADLVAASIKTGVNLFGVDGNVIQASGNAVAAEVLASRTFSNAGGAGTGTMTNVGQQNVTPGIAAVTITQGYHNGTGTVAGDADLVAASIKTGVNLFGVDGNVIQASGNAVAAEVLASRTFSNAGGSGTGTMTNVGQQNVIPGTAAVTIMPGYHDGTGAVAGDADLVAGSIKTGVNLFGVDGNVIQASGNAVAAEVLSTKTFSNAGGAGTGAMTNVGQQNVTPGTAAVTITQGYHNGTGTVAGDTDLVAGNIKSGVNLFGVAGTLSVPTSLSLLKTGQTLCDTTGAGVMGACPGTPAGQDGSLQKGTTRSYTNNSDGTITDNVTSLMWENLCDQDPPGGTCPTAHDTDTTYSWVDAFTKVAAMNTANYAGHNDWRLPNVSELQSLADYGGDGVDAAIDVKFRTGCTAPCSGTSCSCTQAGYYWTSTSYGPAPVNAWAVYFYDGRSYTNGKGGVFYVRAVRGG